MRLSKLHVVCALTALLVAGCTKPDSPPDGVNGVYNNDGAATFSIDSVEGTAMILKPPTGMQSENAPLTTWNIPQTVSFTFIACIKDRATRADAAGHKFIVENPVTKQRIEDLQPTTRKGCFSWREPINYRYFVGRSKWVEVDRVIMGTGIHSGRQVIHLALNPWAAGGDSRDGGSGANPVIFLRDRPLDPSLLISADNADKAFSGELLGKDKLFVDDVDIQAIRKGEVTSGVFLQLNISMEPKVRFEDYAGQPQFKSLPAGDFNVIAHLVVDRTGPELKDRQIITAAGDMGSSDEIGIIGQGKVINGKLVVRINAWADPRQSQGNLQLVMKLIPVGVANLQDLEGVFELGALRNLSAGGSGSPTEQCREGMLNEGCNVAAYLKAASNYEEIRKQSIEAFKGSPYLFDRLRLRFVQVQPGETTTRRTVAYAASTCVTDAFTGDRPVGLDFTVRDRNTGETFEAKTQEDGCLNWSSTIFHKYYEPEKFIENVVTISRQTSFQREMKFYLNPWDDKFTFGFDYREFKPQFWEKVMSRPKIPSRFFMSHYGYHTVRFQYNIDSLMSLEVRKTVLMELEPRVLRYSGIINARKMTEPLRDGMWLLKVALQKNYLDPAQMGVYIDPLLEGEEQRREKQSMIRLANEGADLAQVKSSTRLRRLGIEAPHREFIDTQTTLVRSTDGAIIQPVELRMQDLRMMRVRSNFLLELQPVDERLLQAENAMHKGFTETVDKLLADRKRERELKSQSNEDAAQDLSVTLAEKDKQIENFVAERRQTIRTVFRDIGKNLGMAGTTTFSLDQFNLSDSQREYIAPMLNELNVRLDQNDFTNIMLPSCANIDCNQFVEEDSGLKARTFVGPVIFLSNAFSDSVRATDSLDEARCGRKVEFDDPFEQQLKAYETSLFSEDDAKVEPERLNTIYNFSEYFGSLRHLCYKQVDDLIAREKENRLLYDKNIPAVSSPYNYAVNMNSRFLSLSDEPLRKVEFSAAELERCNGDLPSCMNRPEAVTDEHRLPLNTALGWLKQDLAWTTPSFFSWNRWSSNGDVKASDWTAEDLKDVLFDRKSEAGARFASCTLLSNLMGENVRLAGYEQRYVTEAKGKLLQACIDNASQPVNYDRKIRVTKTAQEGDSYVFLGGYQLNINVGQSFAVGRSTSYSGSWGVDAFDMVGGWVAPGSKPVGSIVKPFSLKVGGGTALGSGDGTSVSDSTYLVAQIAKFRVRLDEYEKCVSLRFKHEFIEPFLFEIMGGRGTQYRKVKYDKILRFNQPIFVCEGVRRTDPYYADEHYFYFTQHFTEGDMLDQADLYNHPWLMALRGIRDFTVFMNLIRAQEDVSIGKYMRETVGNISGVGEGTPIRETDWPLYHMHDTYRDIMPSFPGYYTELDETEGLTKFPLEGRLRRNDPDANNEVISRIQKAKLGWSTE